MTDLERQVDSALRDVLDVTAAERTAALERLAEDDPEVAQRVERALALLGTHDDYLEQPATVDLCALLDGPEPVPRLPRLELPFELAGFTLTEFLGAGRAGGVYRARQAFPSRDVAVKLVPISGGDEELRAVRAEADTLARLEHPGIATIHEAHVVELDDRSVAMIAMEFVYDARTLDEDARVVERRLRDRVAIGARIAEALHHAHQKGVLHRDVKPRNVLVSKDGTPKVIDFGIAGTIDDPDRALDGAVRGSWHTMSPEHLRGAGETDVRSDVYSLGIVLYRWLSGRAPYGDDLGDVQGLIAAIREAEPPPMGVDADLDAIVARCLAKSPPDRYPSMATLADDLRRWLRHEPVAARPAGTLHALRLLARRRPWAVGGAVAGAVVLAVIAGVMTGLYLHADRLARDLGVAEADRLERAEDVLRARGELAELQTVIARALRSTDGAAFGWTDEFVASLATSVTEATDDSARGRLIRTAVETLARLEDVAPLDAELAASIAATYVEVGDLHALHWMATPEQAAAVESPYRRAVTLYEGVTASEGPALEHLEGLVTARSRLSQTLRKLGRSAEAREVGHAAVEAGERLVARDDVTIHGRILAAHALWARSDAVIRIGPEATGLDDARRAVEILTDADGAPLAPTTRYAIAWSHFRIALWLDRQFDRPQEALHHARRGNDLHLASLADDPADAGALMSLVDQAGAEIELLASLSGAEAAAERAVTISDRVVAALDAGHTPVTIDAAVVSRLSELEALDAVGRTDAARERTLALAHGFALGERLPPTTRRAVLLAAAERSAPVDVEAARWMLTRLAEVPGAPLDNERDRLEAVTRRLGP